MEEHHPQLGNGEKCEKEMDVSGSVSRARMSWAEREEKSIPGRKGFLCADAQTLPGHWRGAGGGKQHFLYQEQINEQNRFPVTYSCGWRSLFAVSLGRRGRTNAGVSCPAWGAAAPRARF